MSGLQTKNREEFENIGPIWKKMTGVEKVWFSMFLSGLNQSRRHLNAISPCDLTTNKVWSEWIYESNVRQRTKEVTTKERHPRYSMQDYIPMMGYSEDTMIRMIDSLQTISERNRNLINSEQSWTASYEQAEAARRTSEQESDAADFYNYIEGLLERNRRIIERGEAVWQKTEEELEALIKQQQDDIEETNQMETTI